jgi:hypothetical protein
MPDPSPKSNLFQQEMKEEMKNKAITFSVKRNSMPSWSLASIFNALRVSDNSSSKGN